MTEVMHIVLIEHNDIACNMAVKLMIPGTCHGRGGETAYTVVHEGLLNCKFIAYRVSWLKCYRNINVDRPSRCAALAKATHTFLNDIDRIACDTELKSPD